jgi:hypothetical protein
MMMMTPCCARQEVIGAHTKMLVPQCDLQGREGDASMWDGECGCGLHVDVSHESVCAL